ncbi:polyprenyl synthetase family protein [Fictibacillus iocasae]|uniref:Polyprenyl synthetase family protein n=1 Tax=Fictibacillus iocasae TaxID=2715437 RepID=A0ABW2NMM0_9BACL
MLLDAFIADKKKLVEQRLKQLASSSSIPETLGKAIMYSIDAGGKRLRPVLLLAVMETFGCKSEKGLDTACAIEALHTYSLIHDDLPSMDNDDYRRGKLTNHKVFGEAFAILAGDALLTMSFSFIMDDSSLTSDEKVKVAALLSKSAGPLGMVAGQAEDMEAEGAELTADQLQSIHEKKTGQLLQCSVLAGGILSGASDQELKHLKAYAHAIGIAFQIKDDILDVTGDEATIGKPVGSDEANNKTTYPKLFGLEGAKKELTRYIGLAKKELSEIGHDTRVLEQLADYIIARNH